MSSGLAINVPTSFNRVLTDLSFIPDAEENALAYTGLFGTSEAESLINKTPNTNVSGTTARTPEKLTYHQGYFSFVGPGADTTAGTGIRSDIALSSIDTVGFPASIACSFRNIQKTMETSPLNRRLYPIATYFLSSSSLGAGPVLFIGACMLTTGEKRIAAWSGPITNAGSDVLAPQCSVPIDFTATTDLISAAVSRTADGQVCLAVKKGSDAPLTAEFAFPVATYPNNAANTAVRICYGSMESRTVDAGDIMLGQYWHNSALTMSELQQQVALIHLKANARL